MIQVVPAVNYLTVVAIIKIPDDPFNENANRTSVFTFWLLPNNDSVCNQFLPSFYIVTGDRTRIYLESFISGPTCFDSQPIKPSTVLQIDHWYVTYQWSASDGCITVQWFCTTIGNSIGLGSDFIVHKKSDSVSVCTPQCKWKFWSWKFRLIHATVFHPYQNLHPMFPAHAIPTLIYFIHRIQMSSKIMRSIIAM